MVDFVLIMDGGSEFNMMDWTVDHNSILWIGRWIRIQYYGLDGGSEFNMMDWTVDHNSI